MVSVRTDYRNKRIQLLKEISDIAINCLVNLEKRQQEKMSLPELKRIHKELSEQYELACKFFNKSENKIMEVSKSNE